MALVAVIGGSGLTNLDNLEITRREVMRTPFGEASAPLVFGRLGGQEAVFLPRHGYAHTIPPHEVNYRANLWALRETGATRMIAVNAVGAILSELKPGHLLIPDQIIDYTWGRGHTYFENGRGPVTHVDFSQPYCEALRRLLIDSAHDAGYAAREHGTYAATQGPRFESSTEIRRIERDGGDVVGMTGMPETGLARELGLCYASVCLVVNPAAGKAAGEISMTEIERTLDEGMAKVRRLLEQVLRRLALEQAA